MPLTKKDLADIRAALRPDFNAIEHRFDLAKQEFSGVNQRLDTVDAKLEAITEMLTTREEVRNLVRELRKRGIELDEQRIFVS